MYGFPSAKRNELEALLASALRLNPDIRLAESKLAAAEADLQRARLAMLQKLSALYAEREYQRTVQDEAAKRHEEVKELVRRMAATPAELRAALLAVHKARADLEVVEANLAYLAGSSNPMRTVTSTIHLQRKEKTEPTGKSPGSGSQPAKTPQEEFQNRMHLNFGSLGDRKTLIWLMKDPGKADSTLSENYRRLLDRPVKLDATQVSLKDLLGEAIARNVAAEKKAESINLFFRLKKADAHAATFRTQTAIPLGAVFQWAEDEFDCRFVVREYGIVAVERDAVPPGAVLLVDAWKRKPEK